MSLPYLDKLDSKILSRLGLEYQLPIAAAYLLFTAIHADALWNWFNQALIYLITMLVFNTIYYAVLKRKRKNHEGQGT